ncbi:hypothetical protein E3N88_00814 [Mikania micrantha]|uniref:Uncharacterized protein n=1 Tax=Mikania micrantha TaxID=192012 RepID=A0A5N6Q1I0_9ASTR|nr:hypothetical protein E3N88_00814 [Mikania micrantha]
MLPGSPPLPLPHLNRFFLPLLIFYLFFLTRFDDTPHVGKYESPMAPPTPSSSWSHAPLATHDEHQQGLQLLLVQELRPIANPTTVLVNIPDELLDGADEGPEGLLLRGEGGDGVRPCGDDGMLVGVGGDGLDAGDLVAARGDSGDRDLGVGWSLRAVAGAGDLGASWS